MRTFEARVPRARNLLVVCAHPYDVTFALGAAISAFTAAETSVHVLCLTHGRRPDPQPERRVTSARELLDAARILGVRDVTLLDHRAGHLSVTNLEQLTDQVLSAAASADALLTVDATGTGAHPDHVRTMRAALRAARRIGSPLYAWSLVAALGPRRTATIAIDVDRRRQLEATACHTGLPDDDPLRRSGFELRQPREHLVVMCTERTGRSAYARTA